MYGVRPMAGARLSSSVGVKPRPTQEVDAMQKIVASMLAAFTLSMIGISYPGSGWPCNALTRPCHGPVHPL
jgi:hypothetical protein